MMELVEEEDEQPEEAPTSRPLGHRRGMLRYQSLRNHALHAECPLDGDDSADKEDNIWRNFISQCAATFLAVFAVIPSRNLQSSIHFSGQLGKISLVCMYTAYVLGCLLTPTILRLIRAKSLLLTSLFFHIIYSVSNVIPSGYTLLPASCLVGICQPAFWAVQDGLLLHYGLRYSAASRMAPHKALRLFQMATIITIHSAQILGNLLSSGLISASSFRCSDGWGVTSPGVSSSGSLGPALSNQSSAFQPGSRGALGKQSLRQQEQASQTDKWTYTLPFIPIQTRRFSDPSPPVNFYQLLTLIYLCLSVVAMGSVLIFFESPDTALANQRRGGPASWRERLMEVRKALTNPRWLLCWFSAAYVGFAQGIIMCDITKLYGTDVLGCFIVGYMMVSFGTGNLVAVLAVEKLRPGSTHPLSLSAGFLLNVCVLVLTSLWKPEVQQASALLLYTAFWGVADGTLQAQSQAMATRYATDEKDTAMTIFRVCQGLGLIASFLISIFTLELMTSLYVAFSLHVVGFLGLMLISHDLASRDRTPSGEEDASRDDENTCHSQDGDAGDNSNHSTEAVFDVVDGEAAVDL